MGEILDSGFYSVLKSWGFAGDLIGDYFLSTYCMPDQGTMDTRPYLHMEVMVGCGQGGRRCGHQEKKSVRGWGGLNRRQKEMGVRSLGHGHPVGWGTASTEGVPGGLGPECRARRESPGTPDRPRLRIYHQPLSMRVSEPGGALTMG